MELNIVKCALCKETKSLRDSHLIPSFVFKWIKNTSATGYLRNSANANLRRQDGRKVKLLCNDCEIILSLSEKRFSEIIFYPYVNDELSDDFVCQNKISSFKYEDWLLKFVISIHWRHLVTNNLEKNKLSDKQWKILNDIKENWRLFLLGKTNYTGKADSHMLFHQSLAAADGNFPTNLNKNANFYLLRAADSTIVSSKSKLAIYNKIGPISFFTSLKPGKLINANDSRIHLKGNYKVIQRLNNIDLSEFIYITRPNEAMSVFNFSEFQQQKIKASMLSDPIRTITSKTISAQTADKILSMKLDRQ